MNKLNKVCQIQPQNKHPYLEYLQQFTELQKIPTSIADLSSGVIFADLFQLFSEFHLSSNIEDQPKTFSHKFNNLKVIIESIENYWNTTLQTQIESKDIDIVDIGQYGTETQIEKILELFIKTIAKTTENHFFIQKIIQTSQNTQQFLKKIIENTLSMTLQESPRKQKEKRYIDRLLQLDHENEKLQQLISTICDEKYDLQVRLKSTTDLLSERTLEIQRLQAYINQQTFTPQKKRSYAIPDTSDRKQHQIDSLKSHILDLNAKHEKEIQEMLSQMEKISFKAEQYDQIKAEFQLNQSIIINNKELLEQTQNMEKTLSQAKAELMNKENMIIVLKEKIEKYEEKFIEKDRLELQLRGEIERKNVQISDLNHKIERMSPRKSDSCHNLYMEFPEIINTEAEAYIETNKALRQELERSRSALQKTILELDYCQKELQQLKGCDKQNKRLRNLLMEQKTYKGEQIDVLIHALYHLRKKVQQGSIDTRALKNKN